MEYKYYKEYECGSFKRNSSVAPSLFFFLSFFLFSIFLYFCGLISSLYLSLICPLWDLLICPLWDLLFFPFCDLFLTLRATLYILQEYRRSHTLQEVLNIKKTEKLSGCMQMYASASLAGYAIILACDVAIMRARPN